MCNCMVYCIYLCWLRVGEAGRPAGGGWNRSLGTSRPIAWSGGIFYIRFFQSPNNHYCWKWVDKIPHISRGHVFLLGAEVGLLFFLCLLHRFKYWNQIPICIRFISSAEGSGPLSFPNRCIGFSINNLKVPNRMAALSGNRRADNNYLINYIFMSS